MKNILISLIILIIIILSNCNNFINDMKCDEIKKLGQQKEFCENKYLSENENKAIDCIKNFCNICCENIECITKCSHTHSFFPNHDPENILISVCSNKNLGPSFSKFCSNLIKNDQNEFGKCIYNFCYDCCTNELKIYDSEDKKVKECLKGCKPENVDELSFNNKNNKTPEDPEKVVIINSSDKISI